MKEMAKFIALVSLDLLNATHPVAKQLNKAS